MVRDLSRRRFVEAIAATGIATTLAGCGGGGGDGDDGGTDGDDGGGSDDDGTGTGGSDGTESGGGGATAATFDYTFSEDDDVVGSSLNGIAIDYPEGSGAVANANLGGLTLGGGDVSRDISNTGTSNDARTYEITFGGEHTLDADERLVVELSNLDPPSGSYDVTVTINPQSGATEFVESF